MERGFLSQKGDGGRRGVKEKNGVAPSAKEKNEAVKDGVAPSITVASGNNIGTQEANSVKAGHDNLHGENVRETPINFTANPNKGTSYANLFIGESTRKSVNFRTLITPARNGIDVAVPVESIRVISERFVNTAYGFFLEKRVAYPVVANYVRNTWVSSMDGLDSMLENGPWFIRNNPLILKKWDPDVNLLKEDVVNVLVWVKLHGVPVTPFSEDGLSVIVTKLDTPLMLDFYTPDMCMQSWGRSSYAKVMIELRADVELKDTIVVAMPKNCWGGDECPKNLGLYVAKKSKIPSQAPRGVPVGPKVGFKPVKQLYRAVSKNNNVNTSSNKKKDVESTKEGKPLKRVDYSSDHDSEDEVALVDNEIVIFLTSKKVGYGTNSLLEQWKETYENADYDYDPYDDDMYEGQEIPDKIQSICDNLDIKVRGLNYCFFCSLITLCTFL
ncbi:putative reverse transcriptase domain-containing protein [Tanacetum coccineum]